MNSDVDESDEEGDEVESLGDAQLVSGRARAAFRDQLNRVLSRRGTSSSDSNPTPIPTGETSRRTRRQVEEQNPRASFGADLDVLVENAVVHQMLEGAFRTQLESVISRMSSDAMSRMGRTPSTRRETPRPQQNVGQGPPTPPPELPRPPIGQLPGRRSVEDDIARLAEQVANVERMMSASFELQLSVQRIVQQEIAAALASSAHARASASSDIPKPDVQADSSAATPGESAITGLCILCCERSVNCAFNGCGHMCCCMQCAHIAHARGVDSCPICRAPIRSYLQVFPIGAN